MLIGRLDWAWFPSAATAVRTWDRTARHPVILSKLELASWKCTLIVHTRSHCKCAVDSATVWSHSLNCASYPVQHIRSGWRILQRKPVDTFTPITESYPEVVCKLYWLGIICDFHLARSRTGRVWRRGSISCVIMDNIHMVMTRRYARRTLSKDCVSKIGHPSQMLTALIKNT